MNETRSLALDIGGVILADPMPVLLNALVAASPLTRPALLDAYLGLVYPLWSGDDSEEEFFAALLDAARLPDDPEPWRALIIDAMAPLPAAYHLARWSRAATLVVHSNQRTEWLMPALERYDLAHYFSEFFVSDETGLVKPAVESFSVLDHLPSLVYVDDREVNVNVARVYGATALRADRSSRWIERLDRTLAAEPTRSARTPHLVAVR